MRNTNTILKLHKIGSRNLNDLKPSKKRVTEQWINWENECFKYKYTKIHLLLVFYMFLILLNPVASFQFLKGGGKRFDRFTQLD